MERHYGMLWNGIGGFLSGSNFSPPLRPSALLGLAESLLSMPQQKRESLQNALGEFISFVRTKFPNSELMRNIVGQFEPLQKMLNASSSKNPRRALRDFFYLNRATRREANSLSSIIAGRIGDQNGRIRRKNPPPPQRTNISSREPTRNRDATVV